MGFIDTHAHIMDKRFDIDRKEALQRYWRSGGELLINIGATISESKKNIALAEQDKRIFSSVGIHPHEALHITESDIKTISTLAQNDRVVAIGECGLDYFWRRDTRDDRIKIDETKKAQRQLFDVQLSFASKLGLPIVVHGRDAHEDIAALLEKHIREGGLSKRGVLHCFTGTEEEAKTYLDLGFFISFTGIITFGDKTLEEVAQVVSLESVCIETDCPYLAPVPYRGKRNEPAYVREVAKKIAALKSVSLEKVIEQTTKNAKSLFSCE